MLIPWYWLIPAAMLGALTGVAAMALCQAAARGDRQIGINTTPPPKPQGGTRHGDI